MTEEHWAQINDSNYYVSDHGNVKGPKGGLKVYRVKGRYMVKLFEMTTSYSVCRLVAMAFLPNPEKHPCIRFKDGNSFNCHWENLEWFSRVEFPLTFICKTCKEEKDIKQFDKNIVNGKVYHRHECNPCLYKKHKEKMFMRAFQHQTQPA